MNSAIIVGDPADTILTYITENQIDMVIMGTHGRKGLDGLSSDRWPSG